MTSSPRSDSRAGGLIERWISSRDPFERDRALIDAAQTWTRCVSIALWRFAASGWRPVHERGPNDCLPRPELAQAVLTGRLAPDVLPLGTAVIQTSEHGTALLFAGLGSRTDFERIEALLWLRELMDAAELGLDLEPPPFSRGMTDP